MVPAVLLTLIASFAVIMTVSGSAHAQVSPSSCPPYEIEGSITPADAGVDADDVGDAPLASVYVHTAGEPLVGHQVFATFTTGGGEPIGVPVVMTTDAEGRAAVQVPEGATDVSFVSEGPDNPACFVPEGTEPSVALEIGAISGVIPENAPFDDGVNPPEEPGLAHTGPVTTGVVAAAVLVGAVGCGVWMGRGRRVRVLG